MDQSNVVEKNQNLNTKNNKEKISTVKEAGLGWRVFSGIIDGICFAFLWLVLAMWVFTPIANAGLNYSYNMTLGSHYQITSHLFVFQQTDDNGNFVTIEVRDFSEKINSDRSQQSVALYNYDSPEIKPYVTRTYYYYHNFKCAVNIELPKDTESKKYDPIADFYVDPEYKNPINNVSRVEYYTDSWFLTNILEVDKETSYFVRDEKINGTLPEQIVLKEGKSKEDAVKYLKNRAYEAVQNQYYSNYFYNNNQAIKYGQLVIILPPYILSFGIFFFLIPLLRKNGETLGKITNHLAVVSKDGYQVKKRQILFRELILFFLISLSLICVGIGFTSLATCGVMILLLFIWVLINKRHRGPHDLAAYTVVINAKTSVWFIDEKDEERYTKDLEQKMAKYKNVKPDTKHVLSIGSTIVDEDLKKEIEEENSKVK